MKEKDLLLLIDDDQTCNMINKMLLKKKFYEEVCLLSFNVPEEGMEFLKKELIIGGSKIIYILLDINMPVMSGWDFLDEFEKINFSGSKVIISMLTSSLDPRDMKASERYKSVSDFFVKPLNVENISKIESVLRS
ncbi:response regulator [soil metagenome]